MSSSRHFDERQIPSTTQKKLLNDFINWLIPVTTAQIMSYCFSLLQIVGLLVTAGHPACSSFEESADSMLSPREMSTQLHYGSKKLGPVLSTLSDSRGISEWISVTLPSRLFKHATGGEDLSNVDSLDFSLEIFAVVFNDRNSIPLDSFTSLTISTISLLTHATSLTFGLIPDNCIKLISTDRSCEKSKGSEFRDGCSQR